MANKITNFFKRKKEVECGESSTKEGEEEPSSSLKKQKPHHTAMIKTVQKWERELNVSIGKRVADDGITVTEIWCTLCRDHSKDQSTNVSNMLLLIFCFFSCNVK